MKKILFSLTLLMMFVLGDKVEASYSTNDKLPEVESIQILNKEVTSEGKSKVKIKFNKNGNLKRLKYLQISFRHDFDSSPVVKQYFLTEKDFNKKELIIEVDKKDKFKDGEYVLEYLVIHGNERNKGIKRYSRGDLGTGFKSITFGEGEKVFEQLGDLKLKKGVKIITVKTNNRIKNMDYQDRVKVIDSEGNYKKIYISVKGKNLLINLIGKYDTEEEYTLYVKDLYNEKDEKMKIDYKMKFSY